MDWEPIDGRWLSELLSLTWHSSDLNTEEGEYAFTAHPLRRCSVSPILVTTFLLQLDSRFIHLRSLCRYNFFWSVHAGVSPCCSSSLPHTCEYVRTVPSPGEWSAWRMVITQVNLPTSSIFLHFTVTLPFQQQKEKVILKSSHTGSPYWTRKAEWIHSEVSATRKYLSDILKSDGHKSTLNVFHAFAICPISLFQISHVKVNLLYAKGKTKCQAAFHANVLGKLAAKTGTGVQNEGKTRAHGRIPAQLWELCSACLVFKQRKGCPVMDLATAIWRRWSLVWTLRKG